MAEAKQGVILTLANQKGGVAKTTTAAALASIYSQRGLKVLAIDSDAQANLTLQLGIDYLSDPRMRGTVADLYLGKATASEIAISTPFKGIDLVPSSAEAAEVELRIPNKTGSDLLLREMVIADKANYDLIIIDSPPNLGKFVINCINASDYFIIPIDGKWALNSADLVMNLAEENSRVYRLPTKLLGVFLTMVDRTNMTIELRNVINERFENLVFKSEIRRSTVARESATLDTPIPLYSADSAVASDYRSLADEIANRMGKKGWIKK
jgi:chromosome partitioning protein